MRQVTMTLLFNVDKDGMFEVDRKKPASKSQQMASWVDINLMARVTRYVQEYNLPFVPDDCVMLLTQATVYGTLYRANPCYQSIHKEIGRHDWVNVQWSGSHGIVPGRIIVLSIFLRSVHRKLVLQFNQMASMPSSALLNKAYTRCQTKL